MPNEYGVRNKFERQRSAIDLSEGDRAKQSFKDECDINRVMAKYQKTGTVAHFNQYQGQYANAAGIDFQAAMNLVTDAQQMFDDLPSTLRSRFANDPAQFLDFVQNPDNAAEMYELGLSDQPPAEPRNPGPPAAPVGDLGTVTEEVNPNKET